MAELVTDKLWSIIEPLLPKSPPGPKGGRPRISDRQARRGRHLRPQDRHPLAGPTRGDELRQRQHLLAAIRPLDDARCVAATACGAAYRPGQGGGDQSRTRGDRQRERPRGFGGAHGPNPTDRAKAGCKRHILTDARGVPLVVKTTPANIRDDAMTEAMVLSMHRSKGPWVGLGRGPKCSKGTPATARPRTRPEFDVWGSNPCSRRWGRLGSMAAAWARHGTSSSAP